MEGSVLLHFEISLWSLDMHSAFKFVSHQGDMSKQVELIEALNPGACVLKVPGTDIEIGEVILTGEWTGAAWSFATS